MDKRTAHLFLALIDAAAIFACLHVFTALAGVKQQIATAAASISIQKPLGLYIILFVVPLIHASGLIHISQKWKRFANYGLIAVFLVLLVLAYLIDRHVDTSLTKSGYSYCPQKSRRMTISEFRTYLKEGSGCTD